MSRDLMAPRLQEMLRRLDSPKARLILAIDATASRQPTWDLAAKLTAGMCRAAAGSGGLDVQLAYYRGERELSTSRWMSDADALVRAMTGVMCAAGPTQIERVLKHVDQEDRRRKIAAIVLISDACEENPSRLYAAARQLDGVPIFAFQEGNDQHVASVYREIAAVTGGAWAPFDSGAAGRLAELLRAVAAFAAGGRKALADQKTEAAQLLLTQLK